MRQLSMLVISSLFGIPAAGCVTAYSSAAPKAWASSSVITHEQIVQSGAVDAFEAVRRAQTFLSISEGRGQYALRGAMQVTSRGRNSLTLNPQVLLVVDNVFRLDVASLHEIPAENIELIRIFTAMEATPVYGTEGGNGAIVVQTRIPRDDSH